MLSGAGNKTEDAKEREDNIHYVSSQCCAYDLVRLRHKNHSRVRITSCFVSPGHTHVCIVFMWFHFLSQKGTQLSVMLCTEG